jgi:glycosyltransferase involved in cell wall biosynthesis
MPQGMSEERLRQPIRTQDNPSESPDRGMVVQVAWSLSAGGSERYATSLAIGLKRHGYRPVVLAFAVGGAFESALRSESIDFKVLESGVGISVKQVWRLFQEFRRTRPRVIHTHHFAPLLHSLPGAILSGGRLIHTEHGLSAYKTSRYRLALRVMSWFCDAIVVVGDDAARFMLEKVGISRRKLRVIPGGVDLSPCAISREEARNRLGLTVDEPVAVTVARLSPEKNHCMLLRAFARVQDKLNSRLLLVGDGPERSAIETEIARLSLQKSVTLLGVRSDIPEILAASDVFLLSSNREGLPLAVLEAMAAGVPVVATNVGDLPMIVKDGVTGLLVNPDDECEFANALFELLSNENRAKELGNRARKLAEGFSVEAMVRAYESLYDDAPERWALHRC